LSQEVDERARVVRRIRDEWVELNQDYARDLRALAEAFELGYLRGP